MNNRRNTLYIPLLLVMAAQVFVMLLSLAFALDNYENALHDNKVIISFYTFIGLIIASSIYSLSIIFSIKKDYSEQHNKYGKAIILKNSKREMSALIITISLVPAILSLFVVINAFAKSGLSIKRNNYAKRQIRINGVPHFLKQKQVIESLKKKKDASRMIKNALEFKSDKIDTVYNCNLFIIQILNKEEIEFEVKYKEKEVFEIGMSM